MTIGEIKDLTRFLSEEEVEDIKKQIKDKENILKGGNLEEEDMVHVLNSLFAILVIEKTLESNIEEVEELRGQLEGELTEMYMVYDSYLAKFKQEDKKKKKRNWLLDFLFMSENIRSKKETIGVSKKTMDRMQRELTQLRQERNEERLKEIAQGNNREAFNRFCDCPDRQEHPGHSLFECLANEFERVHHMGQRADLGVKPPLPTREDTCRCHPPREVIRPHRDPDRRPIQAPRREPAQQTNPPREPNLINLESRTRSRNG